MQAIYEPKGRALEYAPLACNLYRGCDHSCDYCYAPSVIREKADEFHRNVRPRKGILDALRKDAARLRDDPRHVLLCFTCDPYSAANEEHGLTRKAIEILHEHGLNVEILSKGGRRAMQDFDLLTPEDRVAATLTLVDAAESLRREPGAASPEERFEYLREAKRRGFVTWASLEPVLDVESALEIIRRTHEFVDLFKVGTLNHRPEGKLIDWKTFGHRAVELIESFGNEYYIKNDLRERMGI